MKVHALYHVEFEGLGSIKDWIQKNNLPLSETHLYNGEKLPPVNEFDILIIMGGPMNIYEEDKYSWLKKEKTFIKNAIESNKKVIGICLGAQLIAEVLQSKIYRNKYKEIGWFPIQFSKEITKYTFKGIDLKEAVVFHWHGDTFDLPKSAILFANSIGCKNQGFLYKKNVMALQFHLEVNHASLDEMIKNGASELTSDSFIQSAEKITEIAPKYIKGNNQLLEKLLDAFIFNWKT